METNHLDHADRLLESFLMLARAEHGESDEWATLALDQLAAHAIAERRQVIGDTRIDLRDDLAAAVVRGSETLLARMVANLLDNAIHHNEPGGWVHVETCVRDGSARLSVENGGPWVDPGGARQLAQPFGRLARDRTASTNGVGLGLSIVAAIATAHHGRLSLSARPSGGLRAPSRSPTSTESPSESARRRGRPRVRR